MLISRKLKKLSFVPTHDQIIISTKIEKLSIDFVLDNFKMIFENFELLYLQN